MTIDSGNSSLVRTLTPIETVVVTPDLDGQNNGTNRATGNRPQIAAQNDIDAIKAWLVRFVDTKTTFDNYRKEAERLLLWSTVQLHKPLSSLTHEDLLAYQYFLADPQPAARWIMPRLHSLIAALKHISGPPRRIASGCDLPKQGSPVLFFRTGFTWDSSKSRYSLAGTMDAS